MRQAADFRLILRNIGEIFTADLKRPLLSGGSLLIAVDSDGRFSFIGHEHDFTQLFPSAFADNPAVVHDARGRVVYPGLVDSHTHLVFAKTRENEFAMKARGATYEEIANAGGGILHSAQRTNEASFEELYQESSRRLLQLISYGVTTVEIKSGYALTLAGELKMLRVIKKLKEDMPVEIVATFLGAHAFPASYRTDHEPYMRQIIDEMLPAVHAEGLAEFVDVFCEKGYFSLDETRRIFEKAYSLGFKLKCHADEFNALGGTELAADMGAVSVDHLEEITDTAMEKMAISGTVAGVLPVTSIFSRLPFAPAKRMIEKGVTVALATDFNPGSCMCGFLPLAASLGATQLGLSVEDALRGITINGAKAVCRQDRKGSIELGKDADLVVMETGSWIYPVYHFAHNHAAEVYCKGILFKPEAL